MRSLECGDVLKPTVAIRIAVAHHFQVNQNGYPRQGHSSEKFEDAIVLGIRGRYI